MPNQATILNWNPPANILQLLLNADILLLSELWAVIFFLIWIYEQTLSTINSHKNTFMPFVFEAALRPGVVLCSFSSAGSWRSTQFPCPAGTFSSRLGRGSLGDCSACPAGAFCPPGTSKPVLCPLWVQGTLWGWAGTREMAACGISWLFCFNYCFGALGECFVLTFCVTR